MFELHRQPPNMLSRSWRYFKGPKGIGVYMIEPDDGTANMTGYFPVYFFRPSGPGKLKGTSTQYTRVVRLDTKRKTKGKAMDRAFRMAFGKDRRPSKELTMPAENPIMTAFCLKEKKHVEVKEWRQITTRNGRNMLQSTCPNCMTKVSKYGKLIECPECGNVNPATARDYLCAVCRQAQ